MILFLRKTFNVSRGNKSDSIRSQNKTILGVVEMKENIKIFLFFNIFSGVRESFLRFRSLLSLFPSLRSLCWVDLKSFQHDFDETMNSTSKHCITFSSDHRFLNFLIGWENKMIKGEEVWIIFLRQIWRRQSCQKSKENFLHFLWQLPLIQFTTICSLCSCRSV